jgi:hypothetical protein
MTKFEVSAHWDAEAGVWVAQSSDIPGLVAEAATWDELKSKLVMLAPELIELNKVHVDKDGGQIHILTEDCATVAA